MKKIKLTVVIPTRNRFKKLVHNLGSLLVQTHLPDEILIVDNGSDSRIKILVEALAQTVQIKINYVSESEIGYPRVYNRGLQVAACEWVAFIDDDCIAHRAWVSKIIKAIKTHRDAEVFLGKTEPYYSQQGLALADNFIKKLGLTKLGPNQEVLDFEILDNKNIVYHKKFLELHKLKFDQKLLDLGQGSSEDADLGMQLQQSGAKAYFQPEILVWHKDQTRLIPYYHKLISRTKDYQIYREKWQDFRQKKRFKSVKIETLIKQLKNYIKERQLNFWQTCCLIIHVGISFSLKKIISFLYEKKIIT